MKPILVPSALLAAVLLVPGTSHAQPIASRELLDASIRFHDPGGEWPSGVYRLVVEESRPDGSSRTTTLMIDNGAGVFELTSERDGDLLVGRLDAEGCVWTLNGSSEIPDEARERHRMTSDRLVRLRDYYTFLWGLPMKLRDPGTRIGERVQVSEFEGRPARELRVTYDEPVGKDIWYVYFDPETQAMIGYRFYHDEAANDGEYITLEGMTEGAGLRLPRKRAWYTHQEATLLGTDTVVSIEKP